MDTVEIVESLDELSMRLKVASELLLGAGAFFDDSAQIIDIQAGLSKIQGNLVEIRDYIKDEDPGALPASVREDLVGLSIDLAGFDPALSKFNDAFKGLLASGGSGLLTTEVRDSNRALISSTLALVTQALLGMSARTGSFDLYARSMSDRNIEVGALEVPEATTAGYRTLSMPDIDRLPLGRSLNFAASAEPGDTTPRSSELIPQTEEAVTLSGLVEVMFVTERQVDRDDDPYKVTFKDKRNTGSVTYGSVEVSIPKIHKQGRLERPTVWKLEFRENPDKHIVIKSCETKDLAAWRSAAKRQLAQAGSGEALVFLHGFNVSFEDAVRKAAQIGWDLQFHGLLAAFDWCAEGGIQSYAVDGDNARLAVPQFIKFLGMLKSKVGVTTIHVIAHSMGNLLLVESLRRMAAKDKEKRVFKEVVLAAPDVNADEFRTAIQEIHRKASRYTLYGSASDKAIAVSKDIRNDHPRAGDGGANLVVVKGVDSIDATSVGEDMLGLGHSYFSSERTVLSDLYYVIQESLPASERHGLQAHARGPLPYWVFAP